MKLEIDQPALYAMRHIAATKDVRFYLIGVCVDVRPDAIILVATDGNMLGAYKMPPFMDDNTARQFIIPLELIARLKPTKKDRICTVDYNPESKAITISTQSGASYTGKAIDGIFPGYQRLFPAKFSGEHAQYNPEFLYRFQRFANDTWGKPISPILSHNGDSFTLVSFPERDQFTGIVMPLRADPAPKTSPKWASTTGATVEASAAAQKFVEALTTPA